MNLKILLIFIAQCFSDEPEKQEDSKEPEIPVPQKILKKTHPILTCNQELLNSFGLEGLEAPQKMILEMCPQIQYSCAKVSDQIKSYDRWVGGEQLQLQYVYESLLDNFLEAYNRAIKMKENLQQNPTNQCTLIIERISHFNIEEMVQKLKILLMRYKNFWEKIYQGLYCSIMNSRDHMFFNMTNKKIQFSLKTCRYIIDNNLSLLLYIQNHLPKIANLFTRFISQCKTTGDFFEKPIDPKYIFQQSPIVTGLYQCRDNRNQIGTWQSSCVHICEAFTPLKFPLYFLPSIETFIEYNTFFKEQMIQMDIINEEQKTRLLEEIVESDPLKKIQNMDVIKLVDKTPIQLDEFISVFEDPGIDIYENGFLSNFTKLHSNLYDKIKSSKENMIEIEVKEDEQKEDEENQEIESTKENLTKSFSIALQISFILIFMYN